MKFPISAFLLVVTLTGTIRAETTEPGIITSTIDEDTYEIDLRPESLDRIEWRYRSENFPAISPRTAEELAIKALYELRPSSETWMPYLRNFTFEDSWAAYNFGFHRKDPVTGLFKGILLILVTPSGEVLKPRLIVKAEPGAAANP